MQAAIRESVSELATANVMSNKQPTPDTCSSSSTAASVYEQSGKTNMLQPG